MKNKAIFTLAAQALLLFSFTMHAEPVRRLLFVIDMQTNLLAPGTGGLHVDSLQTGPLIENVNQTIHNAKSLGIPVFYILNEWTNPMVNFFTRNACKKGAAGTELDKRIDVVDSLFFEKSKGNSFSNAKLSDYVTRNGVRTIYVVGIMAEGCINATASEGLKKGIDMRLIVPSIGSSSQKKLDMSIEKLKRHGAKAIRKIEEKTF
jgi:nicotinamidase-related amidase